MVWVDACGIGEHVQVNLGIIVLLNGAAKLGKSAVRRAEALERRDGDCWIERGKTRERK